MSKNTQYNLSHCQATGILSFTAITTDQWVLSSIYHLSLLVTNSQYAVVTIIISEVPYVMYVETEKHLTYKAPKCNELILSGGHGYRPDRRRRRYSTFAPFPGQMYATAVLAEGQVCEGAKVSIYQAVSHKYSSSSSDGGQYLALCAGRAAPPLPFCPRRH